MNRLLPCGEYLLVEEIKPEKLDQTDGIILPKKKNNIITVIVIDAGLTYKLDDSIKEKFYSGDKIILDKNTVMIHEYEGKEYMLAHYKVVLFKIENTTTI